MLHRMSDHAQEASSIMSSDVCNREVSSRTTQRDNGKELSLRIIGSTGRCEKHTRR